MNLTERSINILYNKFIYLHLKGVNPTEHPKIFEKLSKKGTDPTMKASLNDLINLKEFQFNPFTDRIISLLKEQAKSE